MTLITAISIHMCHLRKRLHFLIVGIIHIPWKDTMLVNYIT